MSIIDRAKHIIVEPKTEWPVIAGEDPNATSIITGYVLPLALAPAVLMLVLSLVFGGQLGVAVAVVSGVAMFLAIVVSIYLMALAFKLLAPNFQSGTDMDRAIQLVAYAYTPTIVGLILFAIPILGWLLAMLAGIYTIYLLYLGIPTIMGTPPEKQVTYLLLVLIVVAVVETILGAIIGAVFAAVLFGGVVLM